MFNIQTGQDGTFYAEQSNAALAQPLNLLQVGDEAIVRVDKIGCEKYAHLYNRRGKMGECTRVRVKNALPG